MKWIRYIFGATLFFATPPALAAVERFAVVIGNNSGGPSDAPLRYAESDAIKMYDTLKSLGGFSPTNLVLLNGENADTVRRALIVTNDRLRAAISTAGRQAVLVVYYSGHADGDSLHMGGSELALLELEQMVRGSAAELRLLILDSCKSGALTRVKGGTPAPPVDVRSESRLEDEGVLFWTASSANEDAQESDAIKGSFFSHALNSALVGAGDADSDGRVTLDEAYRYAAETTIRMTSKSAAGTQHPTFRYDLRGHGNVALTTLWDSARNRGSLTVPAGSSYLVFAGTSAGPVVGEIGANDRARRVSVKPGSYFLRGRGADSLLEGTITVGADERRTVREDELSRVAYARLVRKGGGRSAIGSVEVGARFHSPLPNAGSWCYGPYVGYARTWEVLSLAARAGVCRANFDGAVLGGSTDEASLEGRLTKAWDFGRMSPFVGVELGAALFHQTFSGAAVAPSTTTLGANTALVLGSGFDLGRGFYVTAETGFSLYAFGADAEAGKSALRAALAFRPALGIAKAW